MNLAAGPDPFAPATLGPLRLRNRIIKAAAFEGMSAGGVVSDPLVAHHRAIAAGGAALTTTAYCSVSGDGRTYATQLWMRPEAMPGLRALTDAVHAEGAAASLQLGHCGDFANPKVIGARPWGPSRRFVPYGLTFSRAMAVDDIARVRSDFASAARRAVECGFDAVELHLGHGYLLSQFLSPAINRRRDAYGGDFDGRARFALEVVSAVRDTLGPGAALLVKLNLRDGFAGGLELEECIELGRRLAERGVDAMVPSGGFVSRTPLFMLRGDVPLRDMVAVQERRVAKVALTLFGTALVQRYPFAEAFFFDDALRLAQEVALPVVLLGGVTRLQTIERAMEAGFAFVAMARALLHDPTLPRRLERGETEASACEPCNRCIAEMDRGGVRCVGPGRAA